MVVNGGEVSDFSCGLSRSGLAGNGGENGCEMPDFSCGLSHSSYFRAAVGGAVNRRHEKSDICVNV